MGLITHIDIKWISKDIYTDDMRDMRGIVSGYLIFNQTPFTLNNDYLMERVNRFYQLNQTSEGPSKF